jgi:hypothetical protein
MSRILLGALIATLALSCARTHEPRARALSGPPADLRFLEGEWIGTYHSYQEHGRSGALLFRLEPGDDEVTGCALMRLAGQEMAEALPMTGDLWSHIPPERLITVTFVPAADGTVRGTLGNHHDPVCGCDLRTVFTGRVQGSVMEGTYVSEHLNGAERNTGRWRVARRTTS